MKKHVKILAAALALTLGLGAATAAAGNLLTITVTPDIKVLVNGEAFNPTDANGKSVPVFAYEGTTYAPVRGLAEAFGLDVSYDAARQAAVVTSSAKASGSAPDPRVEYIMAAAPEAFINDEGQQETMYSDVEYDFRWLGFEDNAKLKVELVSGALPEGLALDGARIKGQPLKAAESEAVFRVEGKRDGENVSFDQTIRFQIKTGDVFNAAPVVILGAAGDEVRAYIQSAYNGILYTGDDLIRDPSSEIPAIQWGSSPIGTQAALDELAKYGLSFGFEVQKGDDGFRWADNFITGTLTGATDGWVKISVPVYAGMGSTRTDQSGKPTGWWVTGEGDDTSIVYGNVDVYLNLVSFD